MGIFDRLKWSGKFKISIGNGQGIRKSELAYLYLVVYREFRRDGLVSAPWNFLPVNCIERVLDRDVTGQEKVS